MKYLGSISDKNDLVNKEYVDSGGGQYTFTDTASGISTYAPYVYYRIPAEELDGSDLLIYDWDDFKAASCEFYYTTAEGFTVGGRNYAKFIRYGKNPSDYPYVDIVFSFSYSTFSYNGVTYYCAPTNDSTVIVHTDINKQGSFIYSASM